MDNTVARLKGKKEKIVDCQNLVFPRHAIQQMFLRRISKSEVQAVVTYSEVIIAGICQGITLHKLGLTLTTLYVLSRL